MTLITPSEPTPTRQLNSSNSAEKETKPENHFDRESPVLRIAWDTLRSIIESIGARPAEHGGPFGGPEEGSHVDRFQFDDTARRTGATYSPDHEQLNQLFKKEWNPEKIRLRGFVHSHPGSGNRPSHGDEIYAKRILKAITDLDLLWLPIINTLPDTGGFTLTPWVAVLEDDQLKILRGEVEVLELPKRPHVKISGIRIPVRIDQGNPLSEIQFTPNRELPPLQTDWVRVPVAAPRRRLFAWPFPRRKAEAAAAFEPLRPYPLPRSLRRALRRGTADTFQRVEAAYDLPVMRDSRVIAVGAGGAAEWLEQLARAGLGQFVLVDPDTVSETNLATQQTYRRDIGRFKVDCIAERILDINPSARVVTVPRSLDDLDDAEVERLAKAAIDGQKSRRTVLAGLTDNFWAQARVNRLALQFGLPSLCAQVYREGRGAEVTYTYPGITPACHRCILSSRYRHFLEQQQENDVTSHGTPIFATSRLNAIKGYVTLALFHHGTSHPRWGKLLERLGKRNLVLLRLDPDLANTVGMKTFDKVFSPVDQGHLFFDETLWRSQDAESPATGHAPCPDCGGTGDLRKAIGKLPVTALERPEAD